MAKKRKETKNDRAYFWFQKNTLWDIREPQIFQIFFPKCHWKLNFMGVNSSWAYGIDFPHLFH